MRKDVKNILIIRGSQHVLKVEKLKRWFDRFCSHVYDA